MFVAKPDAAPADTDQVYARPDDVADSGESWRTVLQEYNATPGTNPFGLLPAWQLYRNPAYGTLTGHCSTDRLYILSAGWGLIRADYLTPNYDITFSRDRKVELFKRRDHREAFEDFSLAAGIEDAIVFFGGRNYIPLFCRLTANAQGPRTIFYAGNTLSQCVAPGCTLRKYEKRFTNWHYQCARDYVEDRLQV